MKRILICLFVVLLSTTCKKNGDDNNEEPGDLPDVDLKAKVVASGLSLPWEMVYGPDNYIWFTEKVGKISRLNPSTGQVSLLLTINEVRTNGEGGLLGMTLHPNFVSNPYVYVVYGYGSSYKAKVVRYTYSGSSLTSPLILIDQIPAASIHNGSRLLISGDKLFISTGDASDQSTPQNINSLAGKILRINLDGSIPADNPYPNNPVWSIGHRNAQGLVQVGNKIFSSEHGPDSDDEINIIEKGRNYGWPNIKGFCNETGEQSFCSSNNVAEPLINWTPTIAPSGLAYYNSDYIPQFKNSLLLAVLKGTKLMQLHLDAAQTKITGTKDFYVNTYGRVRAVCQSPEGKVYICTSNGTDDKIVEIAK
ncbi:PQQ-dependent sugar dehydrogenase [Pedobacter sp. HDW13]|uniref:PQQ-dependent sugar dehydrogenase n=1 Tax=unclassified Pedobacter TaxID=2628915 RepID=UPI000F599AF3|nr:MULTISPECIES: PQQ-dependent sugar dehydrogenase [unclassified Pedobacter]QIL41481.1 PQQ-dependent sugar dehydrogenase [Pedobacter sp. HDW13]RQO77942.1 glucose dehydrogenase [Pedobacter sp. KBW01]